MASDDYLPLGCFGKLPCYGDFLEGSVSYPTSRTLKGWLIEGRHAVGLESKDVETTRPLETARRRFLFGMPGSVELMAGVIRPSADQGGRRRFPFMVFAHFPRRLYGKHYPLLPMGLAPVWDALDDAWDNLANVSTKGAFEEVLASTQVPNPAPLAETRAAYEGLQGEAAGRIFGRSRGRMDDVMKSLPEVVRQLRKGSGEGAPRVELPVSGGGGTACSDASFWIDLLNRQFLWRRFEPAVFLEETSGEKTCRLLLIFGILSASDYPLITGCEGSEANVIRPAASAAPAAESSLPEDLSVTYRDLLSKRFDAGA